MPAPPDRVWMYLTRPELVVACLPGAVLEESSEDGLRHSGTVTVRMGALSVCYRGSADFEEVDDTARRLRVAAKGRERTGAGAVTMSMVTEVAAHDGGSQVRVEASAQIAGKIVTLGRGMVDAVMEEVLDEFAACLSRRLSEPDGAPEGAGAPAPRSGPEGPGAERPATGLRVLFRALRRWLAGLIARR